MSLSHVEPYFQRSLMYSRNRKLARHNDKPSKVLKNIDGCNSDQFFMDTLWRETQQLMERSEQLVRLITHVCSEKLNGVYKNESLPRRKSSCCCLRVCEEKSWPTTEELSRPSTQPCDRLIGPQAASFGTDDGEGERAGTDQCPCESTGRNCPSCSESWGSELHLSNWTQCHPNPNWRFLPDGVRGSGAGPPLTKIAKRKHSSGRASSWANPTIRPIKTSFIAFLLLVSSLAKVTESCSSRSTPKPRPASPTLRPNVTFQTYACPPAYAAWFCLNGATCFTVKIQDAILYNCECADGFMGPRCEFKDLDGSYLPTRERVLLETASIAGGACIAIVLVFFVLFSMYVFMHKDREKRRNLDNPYHDRRPLSASTGSDYICTITSLHVEHSKQGLPLNTEIPNSSGLEKASKDLFLVSGISPVRFCTCEQRDSSGQVKCANHAQKFIVPTNVPNCV